MVLQNKLRTDEIFNWFKQCGREALRTYFNYLLNHDDTTLTKLESIEFAKIILEDTPKKRGVELLAALLNNQEVSKDTPFEKD
jgi:hypothetical protein